MGKAWGLLERPFRLELADAIDDPNNYQKSNKHDDVAGKRCPQISSWILYEAECRKALFGNIDGFCQATWYIALKLFRFIMAVQSPDIQPKNYRMFGFRDW